MKKLWILVVALVVVLSTTVWAGEAGQLICQKHGYCYKVKVDHPGGDVTPSQAWAMLQKDPKHTFLIDVRTRPEYQFIGHPVGAYNIPYKFWTGKLGKKKYEKALNPNFKKDLLARFNPKKDTLLFMCRSGHRSCLAAELAVEAGWPPSKVYNILGGFEGDKLKVEGSIFHGWRKLGGWRNEGLPWTYHIDKKYVYKPDLK